MSGGTTVTLGVNIDNQIWLDAANLPRDQVKRGEQLDATLLWRGQRQINTPYTVFIHFVGPNGRIVNQIDSEPPQPTTSWPVSATISVPYLLDVPLDAPPGVYQLLVGMYPTGQPDGRLPVVDVGKTSADNNNRILIKEITVQP